MQDKKIETEQSMLPVHDIRDRKETKHPPKRTHHVVAKKRPYTKVISNAYRQQSERPNANNGTRVNKRKRDTFEAILCPNPKRRVQGKRHFLYQCEISDEETKTALSDQYRETKKVRYEEQKKASGRIGSL